jgi:hypothetical protein
MLMRARNAASVLLPILLCISVCGQQQASISASEDPIVGEWVLNGAKSILPPGDSTVTIETARNRYKITLNFTDDHGRKFSSWTVTDMKGDWSQVTRLGRKSPEKWRVTRDGQDAFVLETFVNTDRYEVSSDGRTLTDRIIHSNLVTYDGPSHPIPGSVRTLKTEYAVLVYDRSGK